MNSNNNDNLLNYLLNNSNIEDKQIVTEEEEEEEEDNEDNEDNCFYYSKTALYPSIITHCVKGNFINTINNNDSKKQQEIIFVKDNCLEILEYFTTTQSLESINHQSLFSTVKDIKVLSLPLNSLTTQSTQNTQNTQQQPSSSSLSLSQNLYQPSFSQQQQQQQISNNSNNKFRSNEELKYFDKDFKSKDFLVVTSDSGYLSILSWSNLKKQFLYVQHYRISSPGYSFKSLGEKIQISPCNRIIGVSALKSKLSLFLVNSNNSNNNEQEEEESTFSIINKQIDLDRQFQLGDIFSFNFVYDKDDLFYTIKNYLYIIVISKMINSNKTILSKFKFNFKNHKIEKVEIGTPSSKLTINQNSNYEIITLPNDILINEISNFNYHHYFLLLSLNTNELILSNSNLEIIKLIKIGNEQIIDYDDKTTTTSRSSFLTSWNWYKPNITTATTNLIYLLIGNDNGTIFKIKFKLEDMNRFAGGSKSINSFSSRIDFKFNPIQFIINLKDDYFSIISDLSDGGIFKFSLKIEDDEDEEDDLGIDDDDGDKEVELIERLDNHSGIIDFDVHKQKYSTKLYTVCSGSNSIGSVKVIENSIPTNVLGDNKLLQNAVATNVWCFNPFIIIGLVESTLISKVDNNNSSNNNNSIDNLNFITNQPTIYCCRIDSINTYIQVTPNSIILFNPTATINNTIKWDTDHGSIITNSCSKDSILLISISKPNRLLSFKVIIGNNNELILKPINNILLDYEISCLSLPHFDNTSPTLIDQGEEEEDSILYNTCVIGNYSMDIIFLNFKTNKQIFSLKDQQLQETIVSKLSAIPHSLLLSILNQQPQQQFKLDSNINNVGGEVIILFKLLCGLRDGKLFKWDIEFNLNQKSISLSSNYYEKVISNSPISIIPVLNQGAIILTNLPYYITCIKNHLTMIKISYKDDQIVSGASLFTTTTTTTSNGSINNSTNNSLKLEFIFTNLDNGFSLISIDFSKRISVRKVDNSSIVKNRNNNNRIKQNPNRILFIKQYNIIIVLGDSNIWVLNAATTDSGSININNSSSNSSYYKEIFSTKDELNLKSGHSIKYWNQKNLVIIYGTNYIGQGIILFYSIQLNDRNSDITLTLEKSRIILDSISSILPISDGKYLVFTISGNLIIDYNNGSETNLEDNQNAQILTPHPITVSKFNQLNNLLFISTDSNGSDIYNWVEQQEDNPDGTFNLIATEKSKYIVDALFLPPNNSIATIDKYGNFKIFNLNQKHDQIPIQQQEISANNNNNNINNFMPVLLEPIIQYSLKETCLKLYKLEDNNSRSKIITCSLLGSVILFGKLNRIEYLILNQIQICLKSNRSNYLYNNNNTRPLLNGDHQLYRSEIGQSKNIVDGDLLYQFLFLDESDQFEIIDSIFTTATTLKYQILSKIISLIEEFDNY